MEKLRSIQDLAALRERLRQEKEKDPRPTVRVCCGTGCLAAGGDEVAATFAAENQKRGGDLHLVTTGCQGWCEKGPLVAIDPHGLFYQRVTSFDVPKILDLTISRGRPIERLLYQDPHGESILKRDQVPFYRKQMRIILRNCGTMDPTNIYDAIRVGAYEALAKVLSSMTPDEVIEAVKRSQLRGRGGAGFPTGRKWELCRMQPVTPKYLVCNGDEGDPGAFMDRTVLEGDPHSVIEGMIIGAYAVGDISEGFIYVRAEYPLAVQNLTIAISQAEALGLLGENILGTGFNFTIEIKRGGGAFVCGESSALMYSIEGKRGMPRQRPPRSIEAGLWDKPTVLNNVKTFASVPVIINQGADWFASIGTERSKGTQVFALTGKVKNTGLIELPMGTTIREIVYDMGEGILDNKKCKAVQIGGPSGGCIPEHLFDTPIDFDSLTSAGAMMGSGGLVVMDESDCMVEIARFFLDFTQKESCGKCPPCRIGTYQMLQTLERIVKGEGRPGDIEFLERLGEEIKAYSLCGLGQTAPNPVLTTIRYFRDEYEAHIYDKYCPTGVCQALGRYRIIAEECLLCGLCSDVCQARAVVEGRDYFVIDQETCTRCGSCLAVCPSGAIVFERGEPRPRVLPKKVLVSEGDGKCDVLKTLEFFSEFAREEMCGECFTCMIGTEQAVTLLNRLTQGAGEEGDLERLEMIAVGVQETARCRRGRKAAEALANSLLQREQYEAHLREKRCPAGSCPGLLHYRIIAERCTMCGRCKEVCPQEAVFGDPYVPYLADNKPYSIHIGRCNNCGACVAVCPANAIVLL